MFFVYAISSLIKDFIYVGQSDHVIRRFHQHNEGLVRSTKAYAPFELIFTNSCPDRKSARAGEKYYKTGAGKRKLKRLRENYRKKLQH